jgi:hypothetical protein
MFGFIFIINLILAEQLFLPENCCLLHLAFPPMIDDYTSDDDVEIYFLLVSQIRNANRRKKFRQVTEFFRFFVPIIAQSIHWIGVAATVFVVKIRYHFLFRRFIITEP